MNIEDIVYKPKTNFSYSMLANYVNALETSNKNNLIPLHKAKPQFKETDYDWIYGNYVEHYSGNYIVDDSLKFQYINKTTLCTCIGQEDIEGHFIFTNDIVYLKVDDEDRLFLVTYGQYIREVVSLEGCVEDTSKVQINGFSFNWISSQLHYDLLPSVDKNNNCDISKMRIIGNIFDDTELAKFYREHLREDTYGR